MMDDAIEKHMDNEDYNLYIYYGELQGYHTYEEDEPMPVLPNRLERIWYELIAMEYCDAWYNMFEFFRTNHIGMTGDPEP